MSQVGDHRSSSDFPSRFVQATRPPLSPHPPSLHPLLSARPEHAAPYELPNLRHVEVGGDVSQRAIEHPTVTPPLLPSHRYDCALYPGRMIPREGSGRQHLDVRIHV